MSELFVGIGKRIKERLEFCGINQKQLSQAANVTDISISQYVHDRRIPDSPSAYKIAKALDVTVEWLLTGENAPAFNEDKVALSSLNFKEAHMIKMYRSLDEREKEDALDIIKLKYNRQSPSSKD